MRPLIAALGVVLTVLMGGGLISVATSVGPAVVDVQTLVIERKTGLRTVDGRVFTGVAIRVHGNGERVSEEPFVDGRRHGTLRRWFPDGQPAFSSSYVNGRRDGVTRSWWRSGNLRSETSYSDDRAHGVALSWYRDGHKYKRFNYVAGEPVGLQQGWRKNGKLFSNFEYRNGRAYGLRNANLCVELEDENLVVQN
ncbi:MAG: toxin-antitoxin system YwqK family antitoxin [Gammaproteobacteria bacterium]